MARIQRVQRVTLLGSAVVVVGYTAWTASQGWTTVHQGTGLLLTTLMRSLAVLSVTWLVFQTDAPREKRAWRLLVVGLALIAISDAFASIIFLSRGDFPATPYSGDLIHMAGLLAVLAMVVYYPASMHEPFTRIREFLDISIILLASSSLAFLTFVWPVFELGLGEAVLVFWLSIAPLFDFALQVFLLRMVLRAPSRTERWTFRILILAFFAYFIGDLSASYNMIRLQPFNQGYRFAAMMAGSVLVMLAALRWSLSERDGLRVRRLEKLRARIAPRLEPLLPIGVTYIVVGYILIDWRYSSDLNWGAVILAGLLSVMLVARQGVVIGQFELRQFAALVQASADAAFVCQLDGRLRLANPALFEMLMVDHRKPELLTLSTLLGEDAAADEILVSARSTGWQGETQVQVPVHDPVRVSLSLMPIQDRTGRTQLLAGSVHDLTLIEERENALREALQDLAEAHAHLEVLNRDLEEKVDERTSELQETVEELRRLNVELQSLDQMKSEFVALVSHELRAPLTNISSGVELILETNTGLDDQAVRSLELVEQETARLTGFVEAILDVSALEAGRFPLVIEPVSIQAVLEQVAVRMPVLKEEHLLAVDLPASLPAVMADERALESVLYHLLDNAVKYAPGSKIEVDAWSEGTDVYTVVRDHGAGIPPELQAKAFEIFQRLDSSDTREIYGHGLGLHMARRFIEAMGGGLRVENAEGSGARLLFHLPRASGFGQGANIDQALKAEGAKR